jgi:hypothetical protein
MGETQGAIMIFNNKADARKEFEKEGALALTHRAPRMIWSGARTTKTTRKAWGWSPETWEVEMEVEAETDETN